MSRPAGAAGLPGATIGESLVENAFRSQLDLRPELVLNGPPTDVSTKTEAYRQKARNCLLYTSPSPRDRG